MFIKKKRKAFCTVVRLYYIPFYTFVTEKGLIGTRVSADPTQMRNEDDLMIRKKLGEFKFLYTKV